nr:hypothetical protein [Tanacetum cinerariifolium]
MSATVNTVDNQEQEITATVDGKEFTVTEASVRRHLQLADADGISVLLNSEIFDQLSLMDEAVYEEWDDKVESVAATDASLDAEQASGNINRTESTAMPNVPLPQGIGAGGSPRCQEAIGGCISQTRVEKLVKKKKARTPQPLKRRLFKVRVESSAEENLDKEDPSKQGKSMIEEIDQDAGTYTRRRRAFSTGSGRISTAGRFSIAEESVSTTGASMPVSTDGMVQEVNINIPSPVAVKDKGKGKMEESKDEQTKRTKLQVHEASQSFTDEEWENNRVRVEADEELTQRLQAEKRNKYNEVDQAKMLVDLINQRKSYFAAQKAKEKRKNPMTQA